MNNETKKLMEEMAIKHNESLRYFENVSFDQVYKNGFTAAYTLAEQEISKLETSLKSAVEELQKINKMVGACPFSNQDKWGDILESVWKISKNVPSQLKSKHLDMFKGEE